MRIPRPTTHVIENKLSRRTEAILKDQVLVQKGNDRKYENFGMTDRRTDCRTYGRIHRTRGRVQRMINNDFSDKLTQHHTMTYLLRALQ